MKYFNNLFETKKMQFIIKCVYVCSFFLLFSCASNLKMFDGSKYHNIKNDDLYKIDSLKIIQVIDNRVKKDSIIGESDYSKTPLIIDRNLTQYLKSAFNSLLCKNPDETAFVPVTVTVNEFYSGRKSSFVAECAYFNSSFLFEYPFGGNIKKISIIDSNVHCNKPDFDQQGVFIRNGIRQAARFFRYYYLINKRDTNKIKDSLSDSMKISKNIDTFNIKNYRKIFRKSGIMFNYYNGLNIHNGYLLTMFSMVKGQGRQSEYGFGLGYQYADIIKSKTVGSFMGMELPWWYRYDLPKISDGLFFLNLSLAISVGTEKTNKIYQGVYFGGRLQESIGYKWSDYSTLSFGLYQSGHFKTRLFKTDFGIFLSLDFTSKYELNL